MSNIILIGFMGCGKTTIGIRLSYRLRMPFEDTDKLIENNLGMTISEIFSKEGEAFFREKETELLSFLLEKSIDNTIISVGGGTPIKEINRELIQRLGTVVYLRIQPDTVYERIKNDKSRPLLQEVNPKERINSLLRERNSKYEAAADIIIDVDHMGMDELVAQIEKQCAKIM